MLFVLLILFFILALFFLISYVCYRIIFYVSPRKRESSPDELLPKGKIYEPFWEDMRKWSQEMRDTPHEEFSVVSFDGLKLYGRYYEFAPGAPVELMFHGYRGNAERDLAGGMQRCFAVGHSALIVDQRCAGKSEGNVITFGINEHRDCLKWIDFAIQHFGSDVKIILTGISMGASTVLMAAGNSLPENVIGVLADCGFHSAKEIICVVARKMHLPATLLYPFVKFAARFFGHFNLEENSPAEAIAGCSIPVIFFHGESDDYVPCYMSKINYDACVSRKKLVIISGAGHGLSYPVAPERYLHEVRKFFSV